MDLHFTCLAVNEYGVITGKADVEPGVYRQEIEAVTTDGTDETGSATVTLTFHVTKPIDAIEALNTLPPAGASGDGKGNTLCQKRFIYRMAA